MRCFRADSPELPIRVTTISADRRDRTSSSRKPRPRFEQRSVGERSRWSTCRAGRRSRVGSPRVAPTRARAQRGPAGPCVPGRWWTCQGTPLSIVDSGFEVDVFYVRAVKSSRMRPGIRPRSLTVCPLARAHSRTAAVSGAPWRRRRVFAGAAFLAAFVVERAALVRRRGRSRRPAPVSSSKCDWHRSSSYRAVPLSTRIVVTASVLSP